MPDSTTRKGDGKAYLQNLSIDLKRTKYPSVPVEWLPRTYYKDNTANGLTKCIVDFLTFKGWQAERINNTGRQIDRRKTYIDVVGRSRTVGGFEWIKGTGTDGTADISATITGKSVKIEVKIGKDRQSIAQVNYQKMIERAGGIYFIAKDFQSFFDWYNKNFAT